MVIVIIDTSKLVKNIIEGSIRSTLLSFIYYS